MSDNREVKKALKDFKKHYKLSKKIGTTMDDLTIGFIVRHSLPVTLPKKKRK